MRQSAAWRQLADGDTPTTDPGKEKTMAWQDYVNTWLVRRADFDSSSNLIDSSGKGCHLEITGERVTDLCIRCVMEEHGCHLATGDGHRLRYDPEHDFVVVDDADARSQTLKVYRDEAGARRMVCAEMAGGHQVGPVVEVGVWTAEDGSGDPK